MQLRIKKASGEVIVLYDVIEVEEVPLKSSLCSSRCSSVPPSPVSEEAYRSLTPRRSIFPNLYDRRSVSTWNPVCQWVKNQASLLSDCAKCRKRHACIGACTVACIFIYCIAPRASCLGCVIDSVSLRKRRAGMPTNRYTVDDRNLACITGHMV